MRGTNSEVAGMFSAMRSMKTLKARRTVRPRDTFSPLSAGNRKLPRVRIDNIAHGIITLKLPK